MWKRNERGQRKRINASSAGDVSLYYPKGTLLYQTSYRETHLWKHSRSSREYAKRKVHKQPDFVETLMSEWHATILSLQPETFLYPKWRRLRVAGCPCPPDA